MPIHIHRPNNTTTPLFTGGWDEAARQADCKTRVTKKVIGEAPGSFNSGKVKTVKTEIKQGEKTDKQEPGKMRQLKIRFLLMSCYCIFHLGSVAQKVNVAVEKELYIVDTIVIKDPILVAFKENGYYNNVLVSKERLDYVSSDDTSFVNFVGSGRGYLFFQPVEFVCMVNNLIDNYPALEHSRFYTKLINHLGGAGGDPIIVPLDKTTHKLKEHNGWRYNEIYPRKFLLCLAKGSAFNRCMGREEIKIANMDNVYFKVLCPITWK
jgi:hypothetical protein